MKPILIDEQKLGKYTSSGVSYLEYDTNDYQVPFLTRDLIEHIDFLYKMLDENMTYDKWLSLSKSEKKSLERDITIKKLLI